MYLMKAAGIVLLIFTFSRAEFEPGRFNFGADWDFLGQEGNENTSVAKSVDYVTIWLNDPEFNRYWHGDMLKFCKSNNKTPVFYAYIIAKASGLGDSDVGGQLDQQGGGWLKGHFDEVKNRYKDYAEKTANIFGTTRPVIWLMEPDYYQYCNGYGSDISVGEAANYMKEMITIVKGYLPNAVFSLDISPWNNNQSGYISAFDMSLFSFMHTSGGRTEAGGDRIRYDNNNNVTWGNVNDISGKCIIADDGYAQGGQPTGHAHDWDEANNIKARMNNGVAAITQKSPNGDWGNTIDNLKSTLSSTSTKCGFEFPEPAFPLTITIDGGGTVSKSPDAKSYESGTKVTLTATPTSGNKFLRWGGAVSGAATTATVTVTKATEVTATFVDENAKALYVLSVSSSGSGIVEINPKQAEYEAGTEVVLKAYTANSATFNGWTGDMTEKSQMLTISMDKNLSLTASFSGDNISMENILENGDFSDGEAGWTFGAYESADADGAVNDGSFEVTLNSAGTEDWNIQLFQEEVSLQSGVKYQLSFDASTIKTRSVALSHMILEISNEGVYSSV